MAFKHAAWLENSAYPSSTDRNVLEALVPYQGVGRPGHLAVTRTSGLGIAIAPGDLFIKGLQVSEQGTYYTYNDAVLAMTLPGGNGSSQTRWHRIVVRVPDKAYGAPADGTYAEIISGAYGTPGALPAIPFVGGTVVYELARQQLAGNVATIPAPGPINLSYPARAVGAGPNVERYPTAVPGTADLTSTDPTWQVWPSLGVDVAIPPWATSAWCRAEVLGAYAAAGTDDGAGYLAAGLAGVAGDRATMYVPKWTGVAFRCNFVAEGVVDIAPADRNTVAPLRPYAYLAPGQAGRIRADAYCRVNLSVAFYG